MAIAAEARLTLEAFLALPEEKPALEFADGVVTQKVSPKAKHSRLQTMLWLFIRNVVEPNRVAMAFVELRTTFGGRSYVPDVSVYRWERVARTESGELVDDVFAPPDAAVEVVSPGQSALAMVRKCLWYVANGVGAGLVVDPYDGSVLVCRPGGTVATLAAGESIDLRDVIPGLVLEVDPLFASLRSP